MKPTIYTFLGSYWTAMLGLNRKKLIKLFISRINGVEEEEFVFPNKFFCVDFFTILFSVC